MLFRYLVRAREYDMFKKINHALAHIDALIIFGLTIYTFLGVIARYVFREPFQASQVWTEVVLVPVVFLGLAYALEHRRHITVQLIVSRFSTRARRTLYVISNIIIAIVASVYIWKGLELALTKIHERTMEGNILVFPFYLFVPFGGAILLLECISLIRSSTEQVEKKEEKDGT